jgi:glycosyltransferase involved in cell wall biosynthesis
MRLVFWASLTVTFYAYFGYPLLLLVCDRLLGRNRPILKRHMTPSVSILIAARNEEATLPAKLQNLRALDYPAHLIETIIVSDGSTDSTAAILAAAVPQVKSVLLDKPGGKARALNEAVRHATGEILIFLDARQSLDANAIAELVCCFADSEVGAVSGELLLEADAGSDALGLYWKIEKAVRRLESASGSVVGVTGAIYAMRRELFAEIPAGTILDDVFVPMQVVRAGKRVIFQPSAIARDRIFAPWLLSARNPILFRFISHKLLRLVVPLCLAGMLVSAAAAPGEGYRVLFWLQVVFYAAAAIGALLPATKRLKPVAIANTFVMLNAAAVVAFYNFATRREGVWR